MSRNKKYCYIQFQFKYKTEQNEEVYVVGNVDDLVHIKSREISHW